MKERDDGSTVPLIGFACAYTPLPLIAAAGFTPYRVLPLTEAPDRAGRLLHDNICPHVKRSWTAPWGAISRRWRGWCS